MRTVNEFDLDELGVFTLERSCRPALDTAQTPLLVQDEGSLPQVLLAKQIFTQLRVRLSIRTDGLTTVFCQPRTNPDPLGTSVQTRAARAP